jgi:hypothetical protein
MNAEQFAGLFMQNVVRLHGVPAEIVSDRGSLFTSKFWSALCDLLGTKQRLSTAYHPQSDGQTERMNRTLEEMLRSYVASDQSDWDQLLPAAEFAVNNAWQASIQNTPFYLNYGQHPMFPGVIPVKDAGLKVPAARAFAKRIDYAVQRARDCMMAAQQRMAVYYNQSHRQVQYTVGQQVLLSTANMRFKGAGIKKLRPRWVGPFTVTDLVGSVAVRLELHDAWRDMHPVFHVSLIKPYVPGGRSRPAPPPIDWDDGQPCWRVERIIGHRDPPGARGKVREYCVKWEGYDDSSNTWEPRTNLLTCECLIREYHRFAGIAPPPDKWFK